MNAERVRLLITAAMVVVEEVLSWIRNRREEPVTETKNQKEV
jgi:hypothetical protein